MRLGKVTLDTQPSFRPQPLLHQAAEATRQAPLGTSAIVPVSVSVSAHTHTHSLSLSLSLPTRFCILKPRALSHRIPSRTCLTAAFLRQQANLGWTDWTPCFAPIVSHKLNSPASSPLCPICICLKATSSQAISLSIVWHSLPTLISPLPPTTPVSVASFRSGHSLGDLAQAPPLLPEISPSSASEPRKPALAPAPALALALAQTNRRTRHSLFSSSHLSLTELSQTRETSTLKQGAPHPRSALITPPLP